MSDAPGFTDLFAPEDPAAAAAAAPQAWKVMLVDDEPDIHAALRLALEGEVLLGRPLQLHDARSSAQARALLLEHPDTALILLDVVMETEQAGLDLVRHIRQTLGNATVQIVLVTGQPGYAPQREVVAGFEINGYRLKSELTADKIYAAACTALRTHQVMCDLQAQRQELTRTQAELQRLLQERSEALDRNNQRLLETQFAMDRVGMAIVWARVGDGRFTYVNDEACRQLGYSVDEMLELHINEVNAEPDSPAVQRMVLELAERDHSGPIETLHRRKDGSLYPAEVAVYLQRAAGHDSYITFFSDISARRAAAAEAQLRMGQLTQTNRTLEDLNAQLRQAHGQVMQSEKMASIGLLAAGVAHEINNPVGYVRSNLCSLQKYLDDYRRVVEAYAEADRRAGAPGAPAAPVQRLREELEFDFVQQDAVALLNESLSGLDRVTQIVQNLKDFSRMDSDESWVLEDLHRGIDRTLDVIWNHLKYTCEVHKAYGPLPPVQCLPSQLNQIFLNLLVNAADAIEGHGSITIATGVQGDEGWVEIVDTGKGIPPEHLSRIFDPFFTTKPVGKGTGLGLSVSYSIVQKHHGRIEVESTVGQGSTFRVWLPLRQPALNPTA